MDSRAMRAYECCVAQLRIQHWATHLVSLPGHQWHSPGGLSCSDSLRGVVAQVFVAFHTQEIWGWTGDTVESTRGCCSTLLQHPDRLEEDLPPMHLRARVRGCRDAVQLLGGA